LQPSPGGSGAWWAESGIALASCSRLRDDGVVTADMQTEDLDVVIVGAGISGIGAACHLRREGITASFAILEAREVIGGTWDIFRYPGIRSDSDMYTLGYSFRPWASRRAIAEGPLIRDYVRDTAREHEVDRHIRFGHRVRRADWSEAAARWTVEAERADGSVARFRCRFLLGCTGYYDYAHGHEPAIPGLETFAGSVLHPQRWPADFTGEGRRIVVIGSGATAVTLVPALAETARHVTMLQRSPTYVLSLPADDAFAAVAQRLLPARAAHALTRWKNVALALAIYGICQRWPRFARAQLRRGVVAALGPQFEVDRHFNPCYRPWDQRLCIVPDGDLFAALRAGRASVVTDRIRRLVRDGIELESGAVLPADAIVMATGLKLLALGGIELSVDGQRVDPGGRLAYRGVMLEGVPNLVFCFGYTNASWTLRADLVARFATRLIRRMRRRGYASVRPKRTQRAGASQPLLSLTSGYVRRGADVLPHQGERSPWRLHQNHLREWWNLRLGRLGSDALEFRRVPAVEQDDASRSASTPAARTT
jgi:cation diffusion facilitator CzcD-associated flavoprotein CzcO